MCRGAIISPRFIVTSARCMVMPHDKHIVRVGSPVPFQGGTPHEVFEIHNHPEFDSNPTKDLSVLVLEVRVAFADDDKTTDLIWMPNRDEEIAAGSIGLNPAWNAYFTVENNVTKWTPKLETIEFEIGDKYKCLELVKKTENPAFTVDDFLQSHICAKKIGNSGCPGKVGSPLVVNGKLVGIKAYEDDYVCDGKSDKPALFVNIAHLIDQIVLRSGNLVE